MPNICANNNYPAEKNETYKEHFDTFAFPLSDFQKHAIEAIVDGQHSLVCCPTGSGKTLPAEFAVQYFTSRGKRVIYTSPLKALSNEKYYDFTKKYPHITFGILTGDIKVNPDAQVLIMTAEILLNTLFTKKQMASTQTSVSSASAPMSLSFEMDFENDLGCVIMDEIHFINDASRGNVWEQTLMIIPLHIQLVMLSATLDSPEKFAEWIEARDETHQKSVYLSTSNHRIVPLTHYSFITTTQGLFKQIKRDETLTKEIKDTIDRPILMQTAGGQFQEPNFHKIKKTLTLFKQKDIYIKRQHVINQVCKYMFENNLLPAVLFILSRKQIGAVSREITVNLLEDDSKIPYIVDRECEDVIRKLPNYQEYMQLPEYIEMVALLRKGIGIHHSGVMPILREMVEILFSKGYIKLLLATETFSVGLNMPIKTTVFTSLSKFDGVENRYFHSHEYMQCSGRAGRRGIDTVGTVIHLNNLFGATIDQQDYRQIMNGKPQTLVSKFKTSFGMLLNLMGGGGGTDKTAATSNDVLEFMKKSMINNTIENESRAVQTKIAETVTAMAKLKSTIETVNKTPTPILEEYIKLSDVRATAINKKRKEIDRRIEGLKDEYRSIEDDKTRLAAYQKQETEHINLQQEQCNIDDYMLNNLRVIAKFMEDVGFITTGKDQDRDQNIFALTVNGLVASQIKELNCLVFGKIIASGRLNELTSRQLVVFFSCFTNVVVGDDFKTFDHTKTGDPKITELIDIVHRDYEKYQDFECANRIDTGTDYTIHYDLLDYVGAWYDAVDVSDCKLILQRVEEEKGIFLGEFVKAILKINTISGEIEKIAECVGYISLLSNLKEIPKNTLKYVATNQSLYL